MGRAWGSEIFLMYKWGTWRRETPADTDNQAKQNYKNHIERLEEIMEKSQNSRDRQPIAEEGATVARRAEDMRAVYAGKSPVYKGLKRFFDCFLSALALVVLSPVFLITAICIKLEDGGPVFFSQPRMGKDMKTFTFYKFRSMYVDADKKLKDLLKENEQTGHAFKIKDDPRVTKVGKFIRKVSIDELPQLVNIIKGDMSIVGPRPILDWQMLECDDYEQQRQIVQPGLTCYWQISGRSDIKWEQWVELDLDYIRDMSLWTDIKTILRTIPAIFAGEGSY